MDLENVHSGKRVVLFVLESKTSTDEKVQKIIGTIPSSKITIVLQLVFQLCYTLSVRDEKSECSLGVRDNSQKFISINTTQLH